MPQPAVDPYASIPAAEHYPGIVKRRIPGTTRCIVAVGWGPDVEQLVETRLASEIAKMADDEPDPENG